MRMFHITKYLLIIFFIFTETTNLFAQMLAREEGQVNKTLTRDDVMVCKDIVFTIVDGHIKT